MFILFVFAFVTINDVKLMDEVYRAEYSTMERCQQAAFFEHSHAEIAFCIKR